mgnify:FL=1
MDEAGITLEQAAAMFAAAPEPLPVFWRLYYDDQGRPITYSMEELPGNYIEIDADTYHRGPLNVRVVDGQLRYIQHTWSQKLVPSDTGTPCDPRDVAIVVAGEPATYWSRKLYESYKD